MQLLVRNKVKDFSKWYAYFQEDSVAAADHGVIDGEFHYLEAVTTSE